MILTTSYANEEIASRSYQSLVDTMVDEPCRVLLFDNHYPKNSKYFVIDLCDKYGFEYYSFGQNVGAYAAVNFLLSKAGNRAILHDGDHLILTPNWHLALLKVLEDERFIMSTLYNKESYAEMQERGFKKEVVNGVNCSIPDNAVICSLSAINTNEIRTMKGGKKFYGGTELAMWEQLKGRWAFTDDFKEDRDLRIAPQQDWEYTQYKFLYAHGGMDQSFETYLASKPDFIPDLAKIIFP